MSPPPTCRTTHLGPQQLLEGGLPLHVGPTGVRAGLTSTVYSTCTLPLQYLLSPMPRSMGMSSPLLPRPGLYSYSHTWYHHGFLDQGQPGCSPQTGMDESEVSLDTISEYISREVDLGHQHPCLFHHPKLPCSCKSALLVQSQRSTGQRNAPYHRSLLPRGPQW